MTDTDAASTQGTPPKLNETLSLAGTLLEEYLHTTLRAVLEGGKRTEMLRLHDRLTTLAGDEQVEASVRTARDTAFNGNFTFGARAPFVRTTNKSDLWVHEAIMLSPHITADQLVQIRGVARRVLERVDLRSAHRLSGDHPLSELVGRLRTETFVSIGMNAPGSKLGRVAKAHRETVMFEDIARLQALILMLASAASTEAHLTSLSFSLAACICDHV